MHLTRLEVRHLRNLTSVSLSPARGLNIIEGRNGSGKTSLLEAVHLLGLARSFRSIRTTNIVQHGQESITLFSELSNSGTKHRLGIQRYRDNRLHIRLDGQNLHRRAELASLLPLQLITPESVNLLTGSPKERRHFIDWVMFHVEPTFHPTWTSYERLLRQRNALLRSRSRQELNHWDRQLISLGEAIDGLRRETIESLLPHIEHYCNQLLTESRISLQYRAGWSSKEAGYAQALEHALERDLQQRFTSVGPHRADIIFYDHDIRVVDHFSRGQLKLLVCALRLAQMAYLKEHTGKHSVVLLDDLPAELDEQHRMLLLGLLHGLDNQVFVTATDRLQWIADGWEEVKMFHVEHGEFQEVV